MGYFIDRAKLSALVNGNGLEENFKKNSLRLVEQYSKSSKDIKNIPVKDIYPGGFYHIQMQNDSNWMRNAPVFIVDFRKIPGGLILLGVNLNFVPLEVRVLFFDKFITEKDFDKDNFIKVTYQGVYNELRSIGFEYALMEFDASKIGIVHKISMNELSSFLLSAHPTNKYDPRKLFSIWQTKLEKSAERDEAMQKSNLEDFYDVNKEIEGKYEAIKNHIMRIRKNL